MKIWEISCAQNLNNTALSEIQITEKPDPYSKKPNSNENDGITANQEQYSTIFREICLNWIGEIEVDMCHLQN